MSFDRLPSLESQPTASRSTGYSDDPEFTNLTTSLSSRLFSFTSNIGQLNRQLALIGTKKDSVLVRDRVKRLVDETRAGFKSVSEGVKRVQNWEDVSPSMKYTQDKLQKQLASALADFQAVQRLSAEKTRQYVTAARNVHLEEEGQGSSHSHSHRDQKQMELEVPLVQQQAAALADQGEVDFQESLIIQREEEIRGIEQGITELNDIFKDLGTIVVDQGNTLDIIDANVSRAAHDQKAADQELRSAARHQKGARNRACCLLLILAIILTVVLLAIVLG